MSAQAGPRQRLLIVDDSKVIRVTARKILRNHFDTVEAVDGENGWEILSNEGPFSLLVSDLTMPNLDGFGLLDRIRNSPQPDIRDIPVIIITGANDSEATKTRAAQAGATDFISKPFDSVQLLARTQAHASARATANELRHEAFTLEQQAKTDQLTGLANETAFMDRGYQQLSYAVRHKTSLAVVLVEIDDFKRLGSHYGKKTTAALLRHVADTLNLEVRQEDMVARTGTARFSLLLPGLNMAGIRNLAERINRSISMNPLKQGEQRIRVTTSIGVAAPEIRRDTRFDDLLSEAGKHLALASSLGGNQAAFADSVPESAELEVVEVVVMSATPAEPLDPMPRAGVGTRLDAKPADWPGRETLTAELAIQAGADPRHGTIAGRATDAAGMSRHAHASVRAVFNIADMDLDIDETIEITAPFDAHGSKDEDEMKGRSGQQHPENGAAAPATEARLPQPEQNKNGIPVLGNALVPADEDPDAAEVKPKRPGMLRRMLRALLPFGRRKTSA